MYLKASRDPVVQIEREKLTPWAEFPHPLGPCHDLRDPGLQLQVAPGAGLGVAAAETGSEGQSQAPHPGL